MKNLCTISFALATILASCGTSDEAIPYPGNSELSPSDIPLTWTCEAASFSDGERCDCACGALDPDCAGGERPVVGCAIGYRCGPQGLCETSQCLPQCNERVCGDDGCGGICGSCDLGNTCNSVGLCVPNPSPAPPVGWQCAAQYYGAGDGCDCACGAIDPDCDDLSAPVYNCTTGEVCNSAGQCACAPNCNNRECGSDGCGGSCGACAANEDCDLGGGCQTSGDVCEHTCDTIGNQVCRDGEIGICQADSLGCRYIDATQPCASGTCDNDNECTSCGVSCTESISCFENTQSQCYVDADGCGVEQETQCALGCSVSTQRCERCSEAETNFVTSFPAPPDEVERGGMAAWGDYVFLSEGDAGLVIYDVGDFDLVTKLASVQTSGPALAVQVSSQYAYVLTSGATTQGVDVVDVGNPAQPVLLGHVSTHDPRQHEIVDDLLYLADGHGALGGLKIIDVSNPFEPWVVGHRSTSGTAYDVSTHESLAFVATSSSQGIEVIDVSIADSPTWVSVYGGQAYFSVQVLPQQPYLWAGSSDGVEFISISNAGALEAVSSWPLGKTSQFSHYQDSLFSKSRYSVHRFDASISHAPVYQGAVRASPRQNTPVSMVALDELLLATSFENQGAEILSAAWFPLHDRGRLIGWNDGAAMNGRILAVAPWLYDDEVLIYDWGDSTPPQLLATLDLEFNALDEVELLYIEENLLFVGRSKYRQYSSDRIYVDIFDISIPSAPTKLTTIDAGTSYGILGLSVDDDLLYVGASSDLLVFDISDVHDPVSLSELQYRGGAIVLDDFYAYVSRGTGLYVVERQNPTHPVVVNQWYMDSAIQAHGKGGDWLAVATDDKFVRVYDASNAPQFTLVHEIEFPRVVGSIRIAGDIAVMSDRELSFSLDLRDTQPKERATLSSGVNDAWSHIELSGNRVKTINRYGVWKSWNICGDQ